MSRNCDAFNCPATVSPGRFLCLKHWRMVPTEVQREINGHYRAGRKDLAFLSDPVYLQACTDAIRVIARVEGNGIDMHVGKVSAYERLLRVAQKKTKGEAA